MLIEKPRIPIRDILTVGLLPSPLKKLVYRLKGYRLGKGASIGFGSVVIGNKVTIGDHTQIGPFTIVRGDTIDIGMHVKIGAMTFLDTPILSIGDGTKINEQVFVGGLQFPDSTLKVGRNCQIMQMSFINPTRTITIGDDTGIGGHSLIFGHTSWLSQFEGYPVEFDSIEIGNSVSIAWRVFILPGTKIGDGAVIGANSLVHRSIPERCLAVGFPARVVSKPPQLPKTVTRQEKQELLKTIVAEMIHYFSGLHLSCRDLGQDRYQIEHIRKNFFGRRRKIWQLIVFYEIMDKMPHQALDNTSVVLSLFTISDELRCRFNTLNCMWIDVESKERSDNGNDLGEEVAQYLKRYGVRLFRVKTDK